MSFAQQTAAQAMFLTNGYALGLGMPFLIIGLGMKGGMSVVLQMRPHLCKIQTISGIWAQQNSLFLDVPLGQGVTPTYFIAVAAGLLSFLSPCVLPLATRMWDISAVRPWLAQCN